MSLVGSFLSRGRRLAELVRLKPFDTSTPDGRSRERHRRVLITVIGSIGARGLGIIVSLVTIPLTVSYLGDERYGLWMTILSVMAVLSFADFGIGNGLLSAVAEANGKDDPDLARTYVSSAFFLLSAIAGGLAVLFAVAYPWIPWPLVFRVSSATAAAEAGPAMIVFIGSFLINMPLGIVQRIQAGYQDGFQANLWAAAGNILSLIGLLLAIHLRASLPVLVLVLMGAPILATLANGLVLFAHQRPLLRPRWSAVERPAASKILRLGLLFFVLQFAVAVGFSSDNLVTAQILGAGAVTHLSVPVRLFSIPTLLVGFFLAPLWPAYGEAIARGDVAWVKTTLLRSLILTASVTALAAGALYFLATPIIHVWVGNHISPSPLLRLGLAVWCVMGSCGSVIGVFLNAAHIVKFQVIVATIMCLVNLGTSIALTLYIGLPGPIWGTILAYTLCSALPLAWYVPRVLAGMGRTTIGFTALAQPAVTDPAAPKALEGQWETTP